MLIFLIILFIGCAKRSEEEINRARPARDGYAMSEGAGNLRVPIRAEWIEFYQDGILILRVEDVRDTSVIRGGNSNGFWRIEMNTREGRIIMHIHDRNRFSMVYRR